VYAWIGVADNAGTVVASSGDVLLGKSIANRPVFQNARLGLWTGDAHEAGNLAPYMPREGNNTPQLVDIAVPLRSAEGSARGVLVLQLSWQWASRLRDSVSRPLNASRGAQLVIVDAGGRVLLAPQHQVTGLPDLPSLLHDGSERWSVQHEGEADAASTLTAVAAVPADGGFTGLGWRVVAADSTAAIESDIHNLHHDTLVFAALGSALCAAFACWLIGAIARPLERLTCTLRNPLTCADDSRRRSDAQLIGESIRQMQRSLKPHEHQVQPLASQTLHDPLTGLWNRTYLKQFSDQLLLEAAWRPMEICVLCLDLDRFKTINDTHGFESGDCVLQEVAGRVRQMSRNGDLAFRLGGDEFLLLFPCPVGEGQTLSQRTAQRMVAEIAQPLMHQGHVLKIGCSVGASVWRGDSTLADAMAMADAALYRAKRGGRGQFRFNPGLVAV
jgi:diguanylate cyclase (GGDEF)-like protein